MRSLIDAMIGALGGMYGEEGGPTQMTENEVISLCMALESVMEPVVWVGLYEQLGEDLREWLAVTLDTTTTFVRLFIADMKMHLTDHDEMYIQKKLKDLFDWLMREASSISSSQLPRDVSGDEALQRAIRESRISHYREANRGVKNDNGLMVIRIEGESSTQAKKRKNPTVLIDLTGDDNSDTERGDGSANNPFLLDTDDFAASDDSSPPRKRERTRSINRRGLSGDISNPANQSPASMHNINPMHRSGDRSDRHSLGSSGAVQINTFNTSQHSHQRRGTPSAAPRDPVIAPGGSGRLATLNVHPAMTRQPGGESSHITSHHIPRRTPVVRRTLSANQAGLESSSSSSSHSGTSAASANTVFRLAEARDMANWFVKRRSSSNLG